jgi:monoamine oxidase
MIKSESETVTKIHDFDVAVVGGGVSGAYCAWRLQRTPTEQLGSDLALLAKQRPDKKLRVGLFEYSDRIGGRLLSLHLPGVNLPVELGGVRFLESHKRVVKLVEHFGLSKEELPVSDPDGKHLFYLRGYHSTASDWNRPGFDPPYRLESSERTRSPGQLLHEVAFRHRQGIQQNPEYYRNIGFWNLLLDELSDQAYRLIRDAVGYESIVSNWNAAEAILFLLADFAPDAKYYRLQKGFEHLPHIMSEDFKAAGGKILKLHRLHRLDRNPSNGNIRLTFDKKQSSSKLSGRRILGKEVLYEAHHVILALPRRAIEMLHPDSFIFDSSTFESDIKAVLAQPTFKIFAAYRRPWRQTARQISAGRSITDLPLRQCYYWHTADGKNGNWNSVLMSSYSDGASVEFWAGLARDPNRYQPPFHSSPPGIGIPAEGDLNNSLAPKAMVEEMQRQLRELHGVADLPVPDPLTSPFIPPYIAVFQDWAQDPFGGGWHFWKIGADSKQVMQRMQRPLPEEPLYICGEAWSTQQGWVEGALETADIVLEEQLHLQPLY